MAIPDNNQIGGMLLVRFSPSCKDVLEASLCVEKLAKKCLMVGPHDLQTFGPAFLPPLGSEILRVEPSFVLFEIHVP